MDLTMKNGMGHRLGVGPLLVTTNELVMIETARDGSPTKEAALPPKICKKTEIGYSGTWFVSAILYNYLL
jgi:hypothetical protein